MQAQIVDRLLHGKSEEPGDAKVLQKFCKQLGESLEGLFKDRFHHEASVEEEHISKADFADFAGSASEVELLAIAKDQSDAPCLVLKYSRQDVAVLSRLIFGGDLDTAAEAQERAFTISELGIVHLFSQIVAKTVLKMMAMKFGSVAVFVPEELDLDELPETDALLGRYEIKTLACLCELKMVFPERWGTGREPDAESQNTNASHTTNEELMRSSVPAVVQLSAQPKSLHHIRNLRVGDCIPLLAGPALTAKLSVRDKVVCTGQLGRSRDLYSFQVGETNKSNQGNSDGASSLKY